MASASDPEQQHREEEGVEAAGGEEEDTGAHVAPIVRLEEVAVTTGEEGEDVLLDLKAKLYRFDKEGNQWKERGVGTVKLLKHKETGKVRLVMRQAKTLKICANHLVVPSITLQEHAGNDKSCVWHASDFSDGELKEETFCIRFGTVESAHRVFVAHETGMTSFSAVLVHPDEVDDCRQFREMFEEIAQSQETKEESKDASAATKLIEQLRVGESNAQSEEAAATPTDPPPASAAT